MSSAEPNRTVSVGRFVETVRRGIGEVPDHESEKMYENLGEGDLIVYDLEEECVWLEREGKRRTKKGHEIRIYGDRSLIEVKDDQDTWEYELVGEPEKKYVLQEDGRVQEKTDIVVDTMNNGGFPGYREGDSK